MVNASFSDKVRRAIESSEISRVDLARSIGIYPSALARFLSGARGLTLDSLDRLVDALGLEIVLGAPKRLIPAPRGRRPIGRNREVARTAAQWSELATSLAREAHDYHFSSRRGLWAFEDEGCICVYNNNPYAMHPKLRDYETKQFRLRMSEAGIKELGYGTYPPAGANQAGYTYALLLEAGPDRADFVAQTMASVVSDSLDLVISPKRYGFADGPRPISEQPVSRDCD